MTNPSDTLAALSEVATKEAGGIAFYSGGSLYTPAQSKFYEALAEAYRTGQLVPVPSVETLARAMAEQANDYDGDVLQWECWADSATAAIAAMQETKP